MAGAAGLEPAMTESKSVVLPITPRPNMYLQKAGVEPAMSPDLCGVEPLEQLPHYAV